MKPLWAQKKSEIIANAADVLEKIKVFPISYDTEAIQLDLNNLLQAGSNNPTFHVLVNAFYKAEAHFKLPVWWDIHRVSVNGIHVDFAEFSDDPLKARYWATIKALSIQKPK